ncbi:MAG: DUF2461 domain-containing protein [Candidatus Nanopelagicales bacterium]
MADRGTPRFTGIPAEAFDFYDALTADPTKSFWEAHKDDYVQHVREPLEALTATLADEFGPAKLFRPYRDVRFSKDKSPYKDHQGAFVAVQDAVGYYVQLSGHGLMAAAGWYAPGGAQVHRYREAVDGSQGGELEAAVETLRRKGFEVSGDVMKTRPRGVDPDHPRIELLRHRSLVASHTWEPAAWMGTKAAATRVRDMWRAARPMVDWLAAYVGPIEEGS